MTRYTHPIEKLGASLPLVPYAEDTTPRALGANYRRVLDKEIKASTYPPDVIWGVIGTNLRRRAHEATQTRETLDFADFTQREFAHYSRLRVREYDEQTAVERAQFFAGGPYMHAYEIFSHLRLDTDDMQDTAFAATSLHIIADRLKRHGMVIPEVVSPKVTRTIKHKMGTFAVVSTKMGIGLIGDDIRLKSQYPGLIQDDIHLKSRQSGLVRLDDLDGDARELVAELASVKPIPGNRDRTDELRQKVEQVLEDNSDHVQPVVESLYMTRRIK